MPPLSFWLLALLLSRASVSNGGGWGREALLRDEKRELGREESSIVAKLQSKRNLLRLYSYPLSDRDAGCNAGGDAAAMQIANMQWEPKLHQVLRMLKAADVVISTNPASADLFHIPVCWANLYFRLRAGCSSAAQKNMHAAQARVVQAMRKVGDYWDAGRPHIVSALRCNVPPAACEGFPAFW